MIAAIVASGVAFFGPSTWRGQRCMRISVCNWRTTADDVQATIAAVRDILSVGGPGAPAAAHEAV